jgi:hypothetical protein
MPPPPPPPHAKLHRHALECIFAFLTVSQLASLLVVSRAWQAAVCSMRGVVHGASLLYCGANATSCTKRLLSRMARHVSSAHFVESPVMEQTRQLFAHAPFLTDLRLPVTNVVEWVDTICFPAHLTRVEFDFAGDVHVEKVHSILRRLPHSSPSIQEICLIFRKSVPTTVSFGLLQSFQCLRQLGVVNAEYNLTGASLSLTHLQVQQLRALTHLERLDCELSSADMMQLLQPVAHDQQPLQWRGLANCEVTDDVCALFGSLPRVHHLNFKHLRPRGEINLNHLALLPALDNLVLCGVRMLSVPLLAVTTLKLSWLDVSTTATALTHFPALTDLELHDVNGFHDLTFLHPVRATLRSLYLNCAGRKTCPPDALLELQGMHQLTSLTVRNSFLWRQNTTYFAAVQPPSKLFPSLQRFQYN